tara:strand:+ start:1784 stop:1933 length:150 start_codon:yes stop_codon:yes gene_type:complete
MSHEPLPAALENWLKLMGVTPRKPIPKNIPVRDMGFKKVALDENGEPSW